MQTSAAQWPHPRPKRRTPRILGDAGRVSMTCSSFGWMLTRTCGKCSGKWANLCCVSFGQLHRPRVAPKKKSRNSIVHINHARDEHAGHQTGWTRNQLFVTKHIGWMRMYLRSEWAAVGDPRVLGGMSIKPQATERTHNLGCTTTTTHPHPLNSQKGVIWREGTPIAPVSKSCCGCQVQVSTRIDRCCTLKMFKNPFAKKYISLSLCGSDNPLKNVF